MSIEIGEIRAKLQDVFQLSDFLPYQEAAIEEIVYGDNKNVIVSLKTQHGKSLIFQLSGSLLKSGIMLVISPGLTLINQQLTYLNGIGLKAVSINSAVLGQDRYKLMDELESKTTDIKFFLIAFEMITNGSRMVNDLIEKKIENGEINQVVVEHGVNDAGYRENAIALKKLRECNTDVKWIILTSSSDAEIHELEDSLAMSNSVIIKGEFHSRMDIFLETKQVLQGSVVSNIIDDIKKLGNDTCGLIYVKTYDACNYLTQQLTQEGIKAKAHFGKAESRSEHIKHFDEWVEGKFPVLVATSESLRYGIVKIPLKFIFHDHFPDSLKNYYQESGRGPRNSGTRSCIYYRNESEIQSFYNGNECRHQTVAKDFGEDIESCVSRCDNCVKRVPVEEAVEKPIEVPKEVQADGSFH